MVGQRFSMVTPVQHPAMRSHLAISPSGRRSRREPSSQFLWKYLSQHGTDHFLPEGKLQRQGRSTLCGKVVLPVEDFSANGHQCLNYMCQPRRGKRTMLPLLFRSA